jgi:hypothetical protein
MVTLPSLRYVRSQKNKWLACAGLHSLQQLLKLTPHKLKQLEAERKYTLFTIPKKDGSKRMIENPPELLKKLQRKINDYLQAVYYFTRHPASFGFCLRVKNEQHPHTIYTHALQHTGCHYLLNADLKDFFHTVSWQKVYDVFSRPPFIHNEAAVKWLCHITTHSGRLPMGAPTSPVISNLAATAMDLAMDALARRNNCRYTRFADDLSFSSVQPYSATLKEEVLACIQEQGFVPNLNKIKEFGRKDIKIVTGLQVGRTVSLGNEYWKKTDMLLAQLSSLLCLMQHRPSITVHNQVEDIKEKINGFLAFAKMIGGPENEKIQQTESRLMNMDEELEMYESLAWDEIPYQF